MTHSKQAVSSCCKSTYRNSHPEHTSVPTCDKCGEPCVPVSPHSKQIKIVCSKKGCPRTVFVDREDTDPINAVSMKMACPWHEGWNGEFDVPIYYDDKGKEITYDSQ